MSRDSGGTLPNKETAEEARKDLVARETAGHAEDHQVI